MRPAFLVFDLVGGNTGLEIKCNARRFIHPELNDREEAVGFVVREKREPSSGRQSFAKGNGTHLGDFETECAFAINTSLHVLTSSTRGLCKRRRSGVSEHAARRAVKISLPEHYTIWCNISMDQLTDVLTAISHPSRRAIIGLLADGPARFTDIAKPFDTALNAVTKHLKLLERAGLIERKKQGREVLISFRGEPLRQAAGWLHEYERFWNERLDQFEQYFKDKKGKKVKKR
jgi:DNA-binding transcriptional ArsR family regulator